MNKIPKPYKAQNKKLIQRDQIPKNPITNNTINNIYFKEKNPMINQIKKENGRENEDINFFSKQFRKRQQSKESNIYQKNIEKDYPLNQRLQNNLSQPHLTKYTETNSSRSRSKNNNTNNNKTTICNTNSNKTNSNSNNNNPINNPINYPKNSCLINNHYYNKRNMKTLLHSKTSLPSFGSSNSNSFFSQCYFKENPSQVPHFEESKDNNYEEYEYDKEIRYTNNSRVFTTSVEVDKLTPIPVRIGEKKNSIAEYDYNEAKRAAVTCRRIEYSYNLRNVIRSEISIDEIVLIQRWWRDILRKRNKILFPQEIKPIIENEKLNDNDNINKKNNIGKYQKLLDEINSIYQIHMLKKFYTILKNKYGKLYYRNLFNRNAIKIQKAVRPYLIHKKVFNFLRFSKLLKRMTIKKQKINLSLSLTQLINDLNKIIKLQNFIKYHQLKKKESYFLREAHNVHPFMYYYLKYGIKDNDKNLKQIHPKTQKFIGMIQKWKEYIKIKRIIRASFFFKNLIAILKKKYFNFLFMKICERINAMLTYFLLKPLMNDIFYIYYRKKLGNAILNWKAGIRKLRRNDILGMNIIKKIICRYAFKPFIKQLKRRQYLLLFIKKINSYYSNRRRKILRRTFMKLFSHFLKNKALTSVSEETFLRGAIKAKKIQTIRKYFSKWKKQVNIFKYIDMKKNCCLKSIMDYINKKKGYLLSKYFYRWRFNIYKSSQFEKKTKFFASKILSCIYKRQKKISFHKIKENYFFGDISNSYRMNKMSKKDCFDYWRNPVLYIQNKNGIIKNVFGLRKIIHKMRNKKNFYILLKNIIDFQDRKNIFKHLSHPNSALPILLTHFFQMRKKD